jgi:hypothetical protein
MVSAPAPIRKKHQNGSATTMGAKKQTNAIIDGVYRRAQFLKYLRKTCAKFNKNCKFSRYLHPIGSELLLVY